MMSCLSNGSAGVYPELDHSKVLIKQPSRHISLRIRKTPTLAQDCLLIGLTEGAANASVFQKE